MSKIIIKVAEEENKTTNGGRLIVPQIHGRSKGYKVDGEKKQGGFVKEAEDKQHTIGTHDPSFLLFNCKSSLSSKPGI